MTHYIAVSQFAHDEFFYKIRSVYQFRVLQETPADLLIQIVPDPSCIRTAVVNVLEETIHQHGDSAFKSRFEMCDHLPASSSGKYHFTMSQVAVAWKAEVQ